MKNRSAPTRDSTHDVLVVGGGPGGAVCAGFCAQSGLRTLLLEKSRFPRDKVCGDCLNPSVWPILDRFRVSDAVLSSPHAKLRHVEFQGIDQKPIRLSLHSSGRGEIAIRRSLFDALLLDRAKECGIELLEGTAVTGVKRRDSDAAWELQTSHGHYRSRFLVAADGRNSTVARLLGLLPPASRERIAIQTHCAGTKVNSETVTLRLLPDGYCGTSPVSDTEINVCLVSRPESLDRVRRWAEKTFEIPEDNPWRSIAPLSRAPTDPKQDRLIFVGDSARVVEPFTGEGIYYAIASAELAARHLAANNLEGFARAQAELYSGRLWVNRLAKWAVLNRRVGTMALEVLRSCPPVLAYLTSRIVHRDSPR